MLDVKAINNDIHLKVIGQSNETVIKNAVYLASIGKLTEIRTVCANTYLNNEETIYCNPQCRGSHHGNSPDSQRHARQVCGKHQCGRRRHCHL